MNCMIYMICCYILCVLLVVFCIVLFGMQGVVYVDVLLKIGFFVKMLEQVWFINEQNVVFVFGQKENFLVVKIGMLDGEKVLVVIDNFGLQGVQGFVICVLDVCFGLVIVLCVKCYNMKFVMVDDQFVDLSGKLLLNVLYFGMLVIKIGNQVGQVIVDEMKWCGWKLEEVGVLCVINYELLIVKLCIDGVMQVLFVNGFCKENIFDVLQKIIDDEGGFSVVVLVFVCYLNVKKWVIYVLNEEIVFGVVCVIEQLYILVVDVIGVGINGVGEVFVEFQKKELIGFYGMIVVSLMNYGKDSMQNFVDWICNGKMLLVDMQMSGKLMMCVNWQVVCVEFGI